MDTELIKLLGGGGSQIILAVGLVAVGVAYWKEKSAHDKTRADHATTQREDLTNYLTITGEMTAAVRSIEKAFYARGNSNV